MNAKNDATAATRFLREVEVPGHADWFVVGHGASRVTVYTQQLRALALAAALAKRRASEGPIVIVGGGAAGLTLAAGLATIFGDRHPECTVTILERRSTLLPLQRHCQKRFLHPRIFDWPEPLADHPDAGLPVLNWRAGRACDVAASLESSFLDVVAETGARIAHRCDVSIAPTGIAPGRVFYRRGDSYDDVPYGTLVFALGFGIEVPFWNGARGSYWADDSLEQHGVFEPGDYLVSGTGDGGVIDLLRIVLLNFRQESLARKVQYAPNFAGLRTQILAIETERDAVARWAMYKRLGRDLELSLSMNPRVTATLVTRDTSPFSLRTQPLHRLLLARLLFAHADQVTFEPRVLIDEERLVHDGKWAVLKGNPDRRFHHAVIRHGPAGASRAFPELQAALDGREASVDRVTHTELEALVREEFGSTTGAIAWSGGPVEEDYLDAVRARVLAMRTARDETVSPTAFGDVWAEVVEAHYLDRDHHPKEGARNEKAEDAELARELRERVSRAETGFALRAHDFRPVQPTFLQGRMGSGKTTFLKLVFSGALDEFYRTAGTSPFPIWVAGPPDVPLELEDGVDPEDEFVAAFVKSALRIAELGSYSSAGSALTRRLARTGHFRGHDVLIVIDAVDDWPANTFRKLVQWLQRRRLPTLVAARRFPEPPQRGGIVGNRVMELVGVTTRSRRTLLMAHLGNEKDCESVEHAVENVRNSAAWAHNPFLLNMLARLVVRGALPATLSRLGMYEATVREATQGLGPLLGALVHVASSSLCHTPPRLTFGREEIPAALRTRANASGLVGGGRRLEFSHLSVAEYLSATQLEDLPTRRLELARFAEPGWRESLDVLAIAHAMNSSALADALNQVATDPEADPRHLVLGMILRAMGYGGEQVQHFAQTHGLKLRQLVAARLKIPSGRFGNDERTLMRWFEYASPFLDMRADSTLRLPACGEPAAEAWNLQEPVSTNLRPPVSYWWQTIRNQARLLAGHDEPAVDAATRGGQEWDAHEALRTDVDNLVTHRDFPWFGGTLTDDSARATMLLNHDDPRGGLRWAAVRRLSKALGAEPSFQVVLRSLIRRDRDMQVRAEAVSALSGDDVNDEICRGLWADVQEAPRHNVALLHSLLEYFAVRDVTSVETWIADGTVAKLLRPSWDYWSLVRACRGRPTLEQALRTRLSAEVTVNEVVAAAKLGMLDELRGLLREGVMRDEILRLLPDNDSATRQVRVELLADATPGLLSVLIPTFKGDASARPLIEPYLEHDDERIALAAFEAVADVSAAWELLRAAEATAAIRNVAARVLLVAPSEHSRLVDFLDNLPPGIPRYDGVAAQIAKGLFDSGADPTGDLALRWLRHRCDEVPNACIAHALASSTVNTALDDALLAIALTADSSVRQRVKLWQRFESHPELKRRLATESRVDMHEVRSEYWAQKAQTVSGLDEMRDAARKARRELEGEGFQRPARRSDRFAAIALLARDESARDELLDHIEDRNIALRNHLFDTLPSDPRLRARVHQKLRSKEWLASFSMDASSLLEFLRGDAVAQAVLFEEVESERLGIGILQSFAELARGHEGLEAWFEQFMETDYTAAALSALAGRPEVRQKLHDMLAENKGNKRGGLTETRAAQILIEFPEERKRLAEHEQHPDRDVRRSAMRALWHLGSAPRSLAELLSVESDRSTRQYALACVANPHEPSTLAALRTCAARDSDARVREQAAKFLRRAEPAPLLRTRFARIAEPDGSLVEDQHVGWVCALLVSTLPSGARIDKPRQPDETSGWMGEYQFRESQHRLRLANDATDLPRDRNVWPAANLLAAWRSAYSMRATSPTTIILACADVAFDDLPWPTLEPGDVVVGPTFFGFRFIEP